MQDTFAILLLSLKESTFETRKKNLFHVHIIIIIKNVYLEYKTSVGIKLLLAYAQNLRILEFEISWRHHVQKHETRNTSSWNIWEVNTVCYWNLTGFYF